MMYKGGFFMGTCRKPTSKSCELCGVAFITAKRSDQKFCSTTCGKRSWEIKKAQTRRAMSPSSACKRCNKEFRHEHYYSGDRQLFCSVFCKNEHHKADKREGNQSHHEQNPVTCKHCKKLFVPRTRIDERFCSNECKTDHHAAEAKRKRAEVRANTTRTCPICDTVFSPKKSLKEIYCAPNCRKAIGRKIYKMMATVYKKCGTDKEDHSHEVLGYSASDLLEKLKVFPQWERLKHGTWHLDHIFPIIAFVRRGIKDASVICSLDNLQPLPGSKNCSKNDKYDETAFEAWLNGRVRNS